MAADGLRHEAVVYRGEEGFVAGVLPYVEEGLERGEPVLAVTTPANAAALRDALGPRAGPLDVRDSREWYRLPGATLTACGRYVERRGGGRRVRIVGEPVWHRLSAAATGDWMRYEWMLNRAFRSTAVSIVCPYDARALPPGVVAGACRTHPRVAGAGPASLAPPSELAPPVGPAPPPGAETLAPLRTAAEARRLAERRARAAGLPDERVATFVLAVNELAANALEHGRPPAELAVWPRARGARA